MGAPNELDSSWIDLKLEIRLAQFLLIVLLTNKSHFLSSTLLEVFKMGWQNRFSGVLRTKDTSGSSNTIEPTEQENYRLILLGMQKVHGHLFQISESKKSN